MFVGLVAPRQSGKSTLASILRDHFDFQIVSFADPLREMAYAIDPLVSESGWTLRDVVDTFGWDEGKERYPELRRFLQRLGTEGVRDIFGEDTWVDLWSARTEYMGCDNVVADDCRFPNEAAEIRLCDDSFIWRIERPGIPIGNHPSEREQLAIEADLTIYNTGDYVQLYEAVEDAMHQLGDPWRR